MTKPMPLTLEVQSICDAFQIELTTVRRITINPTEILFDVFKTNSEGKKYVDPATEEAAMEIRIYKVEI